MENTRHIYVYSLGAFFLFVVYLCLRKQPAQPSGHALPRKATPLDPFFGLDDHIRGIIDGLSFVRNHQKYGHTYRFAPMFGISLIETAHPDNAQTVMAGKDWGVSWRQEMMGQFTGKGIITTDGEEWMKARKTVRPAFRKNVIDDLEFVGRSFDEMMEKIPVDEEKVDLQPLLYEAVRLFYPQNRCSRLAYGLLVHGHSSTLHLWYRRHPQTGAGCPLFPSRFP